MKIADRLRHLIRRRPPTAEELAARSEAEAVREQMRLARAQAEQNENTIDRYGGL